MADFEDVRLKYTGGIANQGRIHLYEYSRAQYALSRLITVVAQYHRSGQVIQRVTSDRTVDMIVSAPVRGSFGLEILVPIAVPAIEALKSTSFEALFAYVWNKLLPPSESQDKMAVRLAEIELEREKQRTSQILGQQESETRRLEILREIIDGQNATSNQRLDLIVNALQNGDPRTLQSGYGPERLIRERDMIMADIARETSLNDRQSELQQFDSRDLTRLAARVRPMVAEIGLPLRRSAEFCAIGNAANDNAFVRLDRERLKQVADRSINEEEIFVVGRLRSYDRYNGRGKIDSDEFNKQMPFVVEPSERINLRDKILAAMRVGNRRFVCASYVDAGGQITSLILRDVIDLEF